MKRQELYTTLLGLLATMNDKATEAIGNREYIKAAAMIEAGTEVVYVLQDAIGGQSPDVTVNLSGPPEAVTKAMESWMDGLITRAVGGTDDYRKVAEARESTQISTITAPKIAYADPEAVEDLEQYRAEV